MFNVWLMLGVLAPKIKESLGLQPLAGGVADRDVDPLGGRLAAELRHLGRPSTAAGT